MTPYLALYDPLKAKNNTNYFFKNFKFLPHFPNEKFRYLFFDVYYFESLKYYLNPRNLPNDVKVVFVEVLELAQPRTSVL